MIDYDRCAQSCENAANSNAAKMICLIDKQVKSRQGTTYSDHSITPAAFTRGQLHCLSTLCWRQIYAWPDRFINWCAHCRRTSWPNGTVRDGSKLESDLGSCAGANADCRWPLRAVAAFCGYFLIDIEMIYVCCLMSSHTQTELAQPDSQFSFHATLRRLSIFGFCFFNIKTTATGYQSLTWCG